MSVSSTTSSVTYAGNASTSAAYPVPFQFIDATDLVVVVNTGGVPTTLVLGTGYTVSGGAGSTGSIVTTSAIAATSTVIISRNTAKTQLTSYTTGDRFPAATHETALDKLTMLVQEATSTAAPPTSTASGAAPYVLQASSAGASPTWVPQSSGGIAANSITNTMLAGSITPGKLSTGGPVWDTSGNLTATSFVGNASTATSAARLTTPRTIALSGDVTGTASFDGSANATIAATISPNSVSTIDIADAAVTGAKIANNAVTAAKLGITENLRIAKCWINFDGTTSGIWAGGASTVSRAAGSTTATVTTTNPHGLTTGNTVWALTGVVAGAYTVTVLTSTTFTITTVATTALSAVAITFQGSMIRSSYNVSSVSKLGVGDYSIGLQTPMADANYVVTQSCLQGTLAAQADNSPNFQPNTYTTASVRGLTSYTDAPVDCLFVNVTIFGN